jgi:hypothetical protein
MQLTGAYDFNYNGTNNKETKYPLYDYYTDQPLGTGGTRNYYGETIRDDERYHARFQTNYELTKKQTPFRCYGGCRSHKNQYKECWCLQGIRDFYTHNTVSSGIGSTSVGTGPGHRPRQQGILEG